MGHEIAPASNGLGVEGEAAAATIRRSVKPYALLSALGSRSALAVAIFAVGFVYRFNALGGSLGGFDNDQFIWISEGRQIVLGEVPFRDFASPGTFLMSYVSATAQSLFGYNLAGEAVVSLALLAVGSAITFVLATEASGSRTAGVLVVLLQTALAPRLYNYPKIILYGLGILAYWKYAAAPGLSRLGVIALCTAVAFLLRHDHGVYLGLGAFALLGAAHWREPARGLRRAALYTATLALLLAPFMAFVQASGRLGEYIDSAIGFSRRDAGRTALPSPRFEVPWPPVRVAPPQPLPPARLIVRWTAATREDVRHASEHAHGLNRPEFLAGESWSYDLVPSSPATLVSVMRDPHVANKLGIVRQALPVVTMSERRALNGVRNAIPVLRLKPADGLISEQNAAAWLYYLFVALPFLAASLLALAWLTGAQGDDAFRRTSIRIVPVIVVGALVNAGFLRGNLVSRLADVSVPMAVLAVWSAAAVIKWRGRLAPAALALILVALPVVATATVASALVLGSVGREVRLVGLRNGVTGVVHRSAAVFHELGVSPPLAQIAEAGEPGPVRLARYVNTCTGPDDRVFTATYLPELFFYAGRKFAGGHVWMMPGFYASHREQRQVISRLRAQSVPIVITEGAELYDEDFRPDFPLIDGYLTVNYAEAGSVRFASGRTLRVLADRRLVASGTYAPLSLPCFR